MYCSVKNSGLGRYGDRQPGSSPVRVAGACARVLRAYSLPGRGESISRHVRAKGFASPARSVRLVACIGIASRAMGMPTHTCRWDADRGESMRASGPVLAMRSVRPMQSVCNTIRVRECDSSSAAHHMSSRGEACAHASEWRRDAHVCCASCQVSGRYMLRLHGAAPHLFLGPTLLTPQLRSLVLLRVPIPPPLRCSPGFVAARAPAKPPTQARRANRSPRAPRRGWRRGWQPLS